MSFMAASGASRCGHRHRTIAGALACSEFGDGAGVVERVDGCERIVVRPAHGCIALGSTHVTATATTIIIGCSRCESCPAATGGET